MAGRRRDAARSQQNTTHPFKGWLPDSSDTHKDHRNMLQFKKDLNHELEKALPSSTRPYENVHVLLLCWKNNDANNLKDMETLKAFLEKEFHYTVKIFQILGTAESCRDWDNRKQLREEINHLFRNADDSALSIIYYSGHGFSNVSKPYRDLDRRYSRKDLVQFPRAEIQDRLGFDPDTDTFGLEYSALFAWSNGIHGNMLHILECCNGGGAACNSKDFEVMSASAADQEPRLHRSAEAASNYGAAFMTAMKYMKDQYGTFTSVQLHAHMISQAANFKKPLHIQPFFSSDFTENRRAVQLTPLTLDSEALVSSSEISQLVATRALEKEARVLLSVALTDHPRDIDYFKAWLLSENRPAFLKLVKAESIFSGRSNSSVLLVTMPISLWCVLPGHPAYSFVDFVWSGDMSDPR